MKQILKRIFHHEELTREEACTLMQRMTGGEMNEAQTAALLAAFQMRGVKVDELVGFRDALLQVFSYFIKSCYHFIKLLTFVLILLKQEQANLFICSLSIPSRGVCSFPTTAKQDSGISPSWEYLCTQ